MAEMTVTVAAAKSTLRTCPGARRAAVLGRWMPLAPAAPANLKLFSPAVRVPRATSPAAVEDGSNTDIVPIPKVIIDQDSDPDATIVEITLGDRLGDLLDTHDLINISHSPTCTTEYDIFFLLEAYHPVTTLTLFFLLLL
ncbi:hypothetical protein ACJX0J_023911 [Zea mays]